MNKQYHLWLAIKVMTFQLIKYLFQLFKANFTFIKNAGQLHFHTSDFPDTAILEEEVYKLWHGVCRGGIYKWLLTYIVLFSMKLSYFQQDSTFLTMLSSLVWMINIIPAQYGFLFSIDLDIFTANFIYQVLPKLTLRQQGSCVQNVPKYIMMAFHCTVPYD